MILTLFEKELYSVRHYYRQIVICFAIFTVAAYAGYIIAVLLQDRAEDYYGAVREIILSNPFGRELPENMFLFILGRNALVSFTALLLGIFTYNIWPVAVLLLNGAMSGFATKMQAVLFHHYTFQIWLFGLLPHGVIELGALFLACGASFYFGGLRREGKFIWIRLLGTYFMLVLPLLVLAAAVESFITPVLIQRFLL